MNFRNKTLVFCVVVFSLVSLRFFFKAYWVPTNAMAPTILGEERDISTQQLTRSGDRILARKFGFRTENLTRGDIIAFKYPDKNPNNPPKDYIKRLIGLPGDRVRLNNGFFYINDKKIVEPYVSEAALGDYETKVPSNSLFVLGDNRNNSSDSRHWGFVPFENVKGIPFLIYYPFERFGFIN